jgi:uncharacterized protein (TIGR03067 family)
LIAPELGYTYMGALRASNVNATDYLAQTVTPFWRFAMKPFSLILLAIGFVAAATGLGQESADKDKIQGTWRIVSFKGGGDILNPDDLKAAKIVIKADKMMWDLGRVALEAKYKIDPSMKPKAIDMVFNAVQKDGKVLNTGKESPGIYVLKGDVLTLCWDANGKSRPVEFSTGESYKEEWRLLVLKRQKKE